MLLMIFPLPTSKSFVGYTSFQQFVCVNIVLEKLTATIRPLSVSTCVLSGTDSVILCGEGADRR